jgi:hypothetical protein
MRRENKLAIGIIAALLVALLAWVAAGPWIAIHGIRDAIRAQDTAALERWVDFPALRVNLKAHVEDAIARRAGEGVQANPFGAIGIRIASGIAGGAVDALATPMGIAAILEGRNTWMRAIGSTENGDTYGPPKTYDPFRDAKQRYESPSRFTVATRDAQGEPLVFVLQHEGLRWRLTDIRFDATGN